MKSKIYEFDPVIYPIKIHVTKDCERMLYELQKSAIEATTEVIDGKVVHIEPFMGTYISRRNRIELNIVN